LTTTFCGTQPGRRLTIVCDGVYPATGEIAPLRVLLNVARRFDARVYVDDAHGFGVLGQNPEPAYPYGRGGGGAARFLDVSPGRLVQVSSLSKAFGAPLAVVAGPSGFVRRLRAEAGAMIHSSPPAIPTLAAAAVALVVNGREGDERRRHLARMVCHLRDGLARVDVPIATPGLFPIQSLHFASPRATFEVATHLRKHGIWCVADFAAIDNPGGGAIRFVLSAAHSLAMIDEALERIVASLASSR
jgi:8-amino-7-oxononanoate synthase